MDSREIEERGARWANVASVLPGFYCAYCLWAARHGEPMSHLPGFTAAILAFVALLAIGGLLNLIRQKSTGNAERDARKEGRTEAPAASLLDDQLAACEDLRRREGIQHESDLYRARQGYEGEREARKAAQLKLEAAEAKIQVFTPLQWRALELSKDLHSFLNEMPAPTTRRRNEYADGAEGTAQFFSDIIAVRGPYIDHLRIMYARQYSERVKTLVEDFTLAGIGDVYLQQYVDGVSNHWHVVYVATTLIRMAHQLDFPEMCKEHDSWQRS